MRKDVVELRDFYGEPLGQMAAGLLAKAVRRAWPEARGLCVAGFGYPAPCLHQYMTEAERLLLLMPTAQGVLHWPEHGPAKTALVEEAQWPLPDLSVDRLLLIHELEHTFHPNELLREAWRVLKEDGRLLLIVPNRRGLWARADHTPFGQGKPYSLQQVTTLLRQAMFVPGAPGGALYVPPHRSRFCQMLMQPLAKVLEAAAGWGLVFGGVLVVEASKQLYAATMVSNREAASTAISVSVPLVGGGQPA